jgi:putative heme-binding domain-containing protein
MPRSFRFWLVCSFLLGRVVSLAQAQPLVAPTDPLPAEEQLKQFHLPAGFKIELIAAEPVCRKPMNLKFDAAGRLYFTQSIEYPWPVEDGKVGRDTIQVMIDTNDDGVPDKAQTFADGLNIPIGITPLHGGVLAYSIPNIYFFPDRDGDLKADSREAYYQKWDTVDTHGMCSSLNWWIDGWVYGCHGFRNDSTIAGKDGQALKFNSGNTYRLKPDGSHIEYYTHGQVNPFGMAFDPYGNVYTSDCHTRPAYQLIRGAYYPSFGKPHDGLGFGPELMQHAHGSTGIAGIVYYAATHFPKEYRDNLFIGNPVTGRINRDTLEITGASYKAIEEPDFLSCDDPWFRPVDIQLAPDGSLYIADFYNKIIGHYEVPLTHPGRDRERGRIWRVSYVGTDPDKPVKAPRIPDLTKANVNELIALLDHDHLPVRVQATHQLVERIGERCVHLVRGVAADRKRRPEQRVHALWVLARLGDTRPSVDALNDPSDLVRVHALKIAGAVDPAWIDQKASPLVRKAAAEVMGFSADVAYFEPLLRLWREADPQDEYLIHAVRIALKSLLIEHPDEVIASIPAVNPFADDWQHLAEVCLAVPTPKSAGLILRSNAMSPWSDAKAAEFAYHTSRYLDDADLAKLLALRDSLRKKPPHVQAAMLRSFQRGYGERGKPLPNETVAWADELATRLFIADDEGARRLGLELVRDLRLASLAAELPAWLASDAKFPALKPLVLDALGAVGHPQFVELCAQLLARPEERLDVQHHAASHLGGRNDDAGRAALLAAFKTASEKLAIGLARGLALGKDGAEALLAAAEKGQASPRLLKDPTVEQRLRNARPAQLDERLQNLFANLPPEDDRLKQMQTARLEGFQRTPGNADAGAKVFEKHCAACHRLAGKGAKIGPDLDGIGLRGLERLLEDTLDPNRNVDGAFRATIINTVAGKVLSGLVLREEGDVVVLADDQGKELRIKAGEIEERKQTSLSPMPANVGEKMTEAEYYDLVQFLLTQKNAPQPPEK